MCVLETERLILRKMEMTDTDALLRIFSDPVAMAHYPSTKDREQTVHWIEWTQNHYEKRGIGLWVVELKDSHTFVGQCGLIPQEVDGVAEVEIGYLFVREHWGRGYATEAAIACRDFGFQQLGCSRLISLINPANHPSIRVAERVGMALEKSVSWRNKEILVYSMNRPST